MQVILAGLQKLELLISHMNGMGSSLKVKCQHNMAGAIKHIKRIAIILSG